MKTTTFKNTAISNSYSSKPFFNKNREGAFFFSNSPELERPFFSPSTIQPKLTIGQPDDKYEQEADSMANQVVKRMESPKSTPAIQTKCEACEREEILHKIDEWEDDEMGMMRRPVFESGELPEDNNTVRLKCAECKVEENFQTKSAGTSSSTPPDLESRLNSSKGGGSFLSEDARTQMEGAFGADFSRVRVHNNSIAIQMNQELGAQAFTHGNDIYFNKGKYSPNSSEGKHLLAHELTHVVQQSSLQPPPANSAAATIDNRTVNTIQRFTAAQFRTAGCHPARSQADLQSDFTRALGYVNAAVRAMSGRLSSDTQQKLRWYFHRENDTPTGSILTNLRNIRTVLRRANTTGNFLCPPSGGTCDDADAFVNVPRGSPPGVIIPGNINLCPSYFEKGDQGRAETLIHEAAHLVGMSVTTDDVYDHTFRFRALSQDQAILNSDSYALFASSIIEGISLSVTVSEGVSGGFVGGAARVGWFGSVYLDATFQHPRLHLFNPTFRASLTLMGIPEGETPFGGSNISAIVGLLPGFRIENPRPSGGSLYVSLHGGPTISLGTDRPQVGAEIGVQAGYRWSVLDLGLGASYNYDPTSRLGSRHLYRVGPTISINFPSINP